MEKEYPPYIPNEDEKEARDTVYKDYQQARDVQWRSYNQFNGRNLYECIDDWTKRWNGYIPPADPLLDATQSRIFLNFTRNAVISYLAKVALNPPKANITAVNKKTGVSDKKFADILEDLERYSHQEENGDAKFLQAALECVTKGTVIVYEGYMYNRQKMKVPQEFDAQTGKIKYKQEWKVIFDNCFQRVVPVEDFFITNPYQFDIQKQPKVMWREITTHDEGDTEFGRYDNWKYVKPGEYTMLSEPSTFYRNRIYTELTKDQIEVIRYYHKTENRHILLVNGVVLYDGPIPFKDGNYPFAKGVYEPFGNDFFWGAGFPQKIMGDQDLINTIWNMMVDKTEGSLMPFGLSSDLDDMIDDDVLVPNKIRKVGDINKWKFETLPGVTSGEQSMLQMAMRFAQDNSGNVMGGGDSMTPRGGKVPVRQTMLKHQEAMQKLGFSMNYIEDYERDRIELRVNHILQFYSKPKIEKITGKNGREIEKMLYRDVKLSNVKLSDGTTGNKIIRLVDDDVTTNPDKRKKLADELSVTEAMGEETEAPTEALAVSVDTFYDYNFSVQIVKNSSYERNQILDQAVRQEFAQWRLSIAQLAPVKVPELVKWVEEAYDIDSELFEPEAQASQPGQPPQPGQSVSPPQGPSPAQQLAPGRVPPLSEIG